MCYMGVKEEHRLRVFEERVLRKMFGHKIKELAGGWANCITTRFMICTPRQKKI